LRQERILVFCYFFKILPQLALLLSFGPRVTQGDSAIKHRPAVSIIGISTKITLSLKLKNLARLGLCQYWFKHTLGQAAQ